MTPRQSPPPAKDRITQQIAAARHVLQQLNFDGERSNERSALVLLALLGLAPEMQWSKATNPPIRTVQIIDWIAANYQRQYAPDTREPR